MSVEEELGAVILSWEEKFGHGSLPESAILSSSLPSISKFWNIFRPESVEDVLDTMVLY